MPTITTKDGTDIYYKDWGTGQPVVFSHGWPLSADAWDKQMQMVANDGFRGIAHDRRGHGRSSQPWDGNDMDTYADDLAELIDSLNVSDIVLVGHSTGGGEITRYMGRHGTSKVAKAVLIGAIPPLMLKTNANPEGTPIEVFDEIRAGIEGDRSQYWEELAVPFYGANRPGSNVSQGLRDAFWLMSEQVGIKAAYDCVKQFSETDFAHDLQTIDVPVFVAHGDDDQIVPIAAAAPKTAKMLANSTLKIYPGASHGIHGAYEEELNKDLIEFLRS
jgi:non-heme chloroperoxidase